MSQRRVERVKALLHREVAQFIERRIKNPEMGFATVTGVSLSSDLKHAKILVVCRGSAEECERSLQILGMCVPSIRRDLKKVLKLRWIPTLIFETDISFDHADRIQILLNNLDNNEETID